MHPTEMQKNEHLKNWAAHHSIMKKTSYFLTTFAKTSSHVLNQNAMSEEHHHLPTYLKLTKDYFFLLNGFNNYQFT